MNDGLIGYFIGLIFGILINPINLKIKNFLRKPKVKVIETGLVLPLGMNVYFIEEWTAFCIKIYVGKIIGIVTEDAGTSYMVKTRYDKHSVPADKIFIAMNRLLESVEKYVETREYP